MLKSHRNLICNGIDAIASLTSVAEVCATFAGAMARFGFSSVGINGLPPPKEGADPVVLTESIPNGFRDFYTDERFYDVDHIAAYARTATEPFRFDEAPYAARRSRPHKRFLEALQSYRIGRGVVVPFGYPISMPACVWLAGEDPEIHRDAIIAIQSMSLFAASKAYALFATRNAGHSKPVTGREREILQWICEGKTAAEIGGILGIAKRTVDAHAQRAARKLNAANRTQAVAIALCERLISL
jgi:LuxR family transcriptional regulator, quorum-sensing system regulator BjaR1